MSNSRNPIMVTIEGSVTPSVVLPRGERRTVVLTDKIQRLIERGYVLEIKREEVRPTSPKKAASAPATSDASPATGGVTGTSTNALSLGDG